MRTVLACGCFDPLHPGHVQHLQEAASLGDYLIVALTLDEHINKGPKRPYLTWDERCTMVSALRCVDEVVPSEHAATAIYEHRPDIFVKGEDWKGKLPQQTEEACRVVGASIRFTKTPRFGVSELVRRIMEKNAE